MKKILSLVAVLGLVAMPVMAAEFIAPDKKGDPNVGTLAQESHENLYIAGATVTVNGSTTGDLYAAGGMVTVNGNVEKDLVVAGGNLSVNGSVGDDLRAAGGNISINSPVTGDLIVAGGNVSVAQKAAVGADLVVASGNIVVDSTVNGNAKICGGNVTINGKITGNLEVIATELLTFGPFSEVTGKITYKGPKPAVVREGAKVGTIEFTQTERRHGAGAFKALFALMTLVKLVALLVAGFVLLYFFPGKVSSVLASAQEKPLHSLGMGFLVLIMLPALTIALFATVIGFYLAFIVMLVYALLLVVTGVLSLFYLGNLVSGWYRKGAAANHKWDLLIGTILMLVLTLIPFVGWIVCLVIYLITLGALVNYYRQKRELV